LASTEKGEEDIRTGFFQESNFYYLTGWQEPGAISVSHTAAGRQNVRFPVPPAPPSGPGKVDGRKAGPDDANINQLTGFDTVLPVESFESELRKQLEHDSAIYTVGEQSTTELKALAPLRDISDAGPDDRAPAHA
jgi:hypothetical protein